MENKYWKEVEEFFSLSEFQTQKILSEIDSSLNEPDRYYHNYNHVTSILKQIEVQELTREDRVILILTAFYHDLVYKAVFNNNEELSSKKLKSHFSFVHHSTVVNKASDIILATKNHLSNDYLTCLFLDMDMSVLGISADNYEIYQKNVRKEYSIIPKSIYKKGRKKFIESILSRENIFKTRVFQVAYEESARKNLLIELNEL